MKNRTKFSYMLIYYDKVKFSIQDIKTENGCVLFDVEGTSIITIGIRKVPL